MGNQTSNDDQAKANQGKLDSSILAKPANQIQVATPEETTGAAQQKVAQTTAQPWRVGEYIGRGWARIKSPESTNLIMAIATVVIAIFTALTFWLVLGSSQDTQKLITAAETQARAAEEISGAADDFTDSAYWMEEQMKDTADAIQDSVDTADRNTRTTITNAQDAFRKEQRAWIGVLDATTIDFAEGKPWTVNISFFNSGRTPARNVHTSVRYRLSDTELAGPSPEDIKQLTFRPAQSIAPQARFNQFLGYVASGRANTPSEMAGIQDLSSKFQAIKDKKLFIYYFGILKYADSSGNQRETQFCIFLANPDTKQPGFCDSFNDLD